MSYTTNSYSTPTQNSQQPSRTTFASRYTPAAAQPQEPAAPAASSAASSDVLDEKTKMELLQSSERYKDTRVKTSDVTSTKDHSFDDYGLKRELLMGIYSMGFEKPSPVQEEAIPIALTNENLLTRAKNGTGKTAAFLIPLLEKIDVSQRHIQALVLVPTRELAIQTYQTVRDLSKHMAVKCQMLVGGNPIPEDVLQLQQPGHLIVATPGRLIDLAEHNVCHLENCHMLVLDEADKLLQTDSKGLIEKTISFCNKQLQIMLFSATFPLSVKDFSSRFMPQAKMVNLMEELTLVGVTQYYAYVDERLKVACLDALFSKLNINQAMIFCNSIERVVLLAKKITEMGQSCFYVHAQMPQNQRNRVFMDFRAGHGRVLVCSDLLSRGIDIRAVNVVINFDMPRSSETYLHRIGRTARFGHLGIAINLITDADKHNMYQIEKELDTEIKSIPPTIDEALYPH